MSNLPADTYAGRVAELCRLYLRDPVSVATDSVTGGSVVLFDPPLSPTEQTRYDRIVRLARSLIDGITATEWEAIEPDIAGLVTYQGLASPTLAQTVLAVKAQSRILRALLRN